MKFVKFESFDKTILQCYLWDDVKSPKGVVQIAHGMAEHARRYDNFAKFLNKNGFVVFADDHRAHGDTETPETIGFHDGDIYLDTIKDMIAITKYLKETYKVPVILVGHSYGSLMSQRYIELYNGIAGVILSGSAMMKGAMIDVGGFIASVQGAFIKKNKKAKLMDKLSFGSYNKPFKEEMPEFGWLSRDKENVDKYIADQQCGYVMSIAFFKYFLNGLRKAYFKRNLNRIDKRLPVAIFSGSDDPVGGKGKLVEKLKAQYEKLGLEHVSMKIYPECRHEILNELNKDEIYADFLAKMNEMLEIDVENQKLRAEEARIAEENRKAEEAKLKEGQRKAEEAQKAKEEARAAKKAAKAKDIKPQEALAEKAEEKKAEDKKEEK